MSDRCDFSGMDKRSCSHCLKLQRGTPENPIFSIAIGNYGGNPVVEIFKNGGPVTRYDKHFTFGCRKARVLLACLPMLKRFGWPSYDDDRSQFQSEIFADNRLDLKVEVAVAINPDFVNSSGELIDKYWLGFREMPTLKLHIGIGVMKARAVCSVQDDLLSWLNRSCG